MRLVAGRVRDCRHGSDRHRRRGVASNRFEENTLCLRTELEQLFGDEEAMTLVAHHQWGADIRHVGEARERLLQHRAFADERQELFGIELA